MMMMMMVYMVYDEIFGSMMLGFYFDFSENLIHYHRIHLLILYSKRKRIFEKNNDHRLVMNDISIIFSKKLKQKKQKNNYHEYERV